MPSKQQAVSTYHPIYHHLPISLQLKRRISTQGTCQIHRRFPAVVHLRHGLVDCWQPGEWPVEKCPSKSISLRIFCEKAVSLYVRISNNLHIFASRFALLKPPAAVGYDLWGSGLQVTSAWLDKLARD